MDDETVTFMSYNSTGLDSVKIKFSLDICENYDVDFLAIQEHFKFVNTDKYFKSGYSNFRSYVIPGHRAPGQMSGRAKAGLAQLSRGELDVKKVRVVTTNFRLQAQVLELPTSRELWLNTYLPTDPRLQQYDDSELQEVLEEVRNILNNIQFDDLVWGSDLNWDPSRNTQFSRTLDAFVRELGLVSLWDTHPVPHTHVHTDGRSTSVLDHFVLSPRLLPLVESCGIVERGDNRSRHCPIWLKLKLGSLPVRKPSPRWVPKRPAWSKATDDQKNAYKHSLEQKLVQLQHHAGQSQCLGCQSLQCKDILHSELRDSYMLDILTAIIESSHLTLPMYGGCWIGKNRPGVNVPGWSREVKPCRDDSIYWGDMWKNAGRPNTGWVHEMYLAARKQYHQAVLKVRRQREQHQAEELLVAAMEGDVQLLKEMKTIRKGKHGGSCELPDSVGGAVGEDNIAEMFKEAYEKLYNSAPSQGEMTDLKAEMEQLMGIADKDQVFKVTGVIVKEAVAKLKPGKTDVSGSYVSNALKHAPDLLYDQLANIFRSWLFHGTVTTSLLACSFLPLLKSSLKDPSDPSSYRAIAGSSLILKIFELVVILLWGHLLTSDSLQFGYKSKTSTTHCTWLVSEVVQHMLRGGIRPIVTVLDCSKAFDKCKFSLLFRRLLDKGLPAVVVRVLAFIYMEQYGWVKWGDAKSSVMTIANGTRQGAILSPIFWAIYADPMLKRLRRLGLGAHVAGLFMGAVCYADDVLLIAPSRNAMQRMLLELEEFAYESNITFSTDPVPSKSKSKCLYVVGSKRNLEKPAPLTLCGRVLPWVNQADHLGNTLTVQGDMEQDAAIKRAQFISSSVQIREVFKFASPAEVVKSMKIYSNSFYGSSLWDLSGEKAKQVYSAWNQTVKLIWGCPLWTRTYFVQQLLCCGHTSAKVDILSRFSKFFHSLRCSASQEVQVLCRYLGRDVQSVTGRNLQLVEELSKLNPWSTSNNKMKHALAAAEQVEVPVQDRWRLPYLCSLLSQRGDAHYHAMEDEEKRLGDLIISLVTN